MIDADWQYIVWVYNFSPWEIYNNSYYGTYIFKYDYGSYIMQGPVYYNFDYYFVGYDWDDDYSYMYNVSMTGYLLLYGNYEGYFVTNTYGSWFTSVAADYSIGMFAYWYTYSYGAAWNSEDYYGQFSIYDAGYFTTFVFEGDYTDNAAIWETEGFEVHYNSNDINAEYYASLAGYYFYRNYIWY